MKIGNALMVFIFLIISVLMGCTRLSQNKIGPNIILLI